MNYVELSEAEQIAEVEKLVPVVLDGYGIEAVTIENVNHAFNSSFRITSADSAEFAVRINLGTGKSRDEVAAEVQWLEALKREGSVLAPRPVRTVEGDCCSSVHFEPLGVEAIAVLFEWIPGVELGDDASNENLFELGRNMARLHEFAQTLEFADGAYLPSINRTLMNSQDNLRPNQPNEIDDELYGLVLRGLELVDSTYSRLSANARLLPIHADLHPFNVIQTPMAQAIIDFDDAGIGLPVQDLVISTYYLREDIDREAHLKAGYASLRELPQVSTDDFETLLMGRLLVLINDVLTMTAADERAFIPTFLERAEKRLKAFFETGVFTLSM
ncbi:MAG: phosphotransferase enzyme family protein [Microbacteriaceae bacterium]